jgi:DNA-directed RNA polymerase specialized sigma24 family protein
VTDEQLQEALGRFRGLIHTKARAVVKAGVEIEFEDAVQILQIKAWQAMLAFDDARTGTGGWKARGKVNRPPLERWVYGCVTNAARDLLKRPRRGVRSLEGIRESESEQDGDRISWFDFHFMCIEAERVYAEVEDEPPHLPSTLTPLERRVVGLRLEGCQLQEIDRETGLSRAQRERVFESVREKMADWRPSTVAQVAPIAA